MDYTKYQNRVKVTGNTINDQYKYAQQQIINDTFSYASDVLTITHINSTTYVETSVETRVDSVYRAKGNPFINADDYRKIIFKNLDYVCNLGDQFVFGGYTWIVIDTEDVSNLSNSVVVRRCNHTLKFYDDGHIYREIEAIISNRVETLQEDKFVVIPDNKTRIFVPYNSKSQQIKFAPTPTRFLINGYAFRVENIDAATNIKKGKGYLEILLIADQIDENDDLVNNISFNSYLPSYSLEILNGTTATIACTPSVQTLQLNTIVYDNGIAVSSTPTSYSSSNISICTVSTAGLITAVAVGSAIITASYSSASDSITITVVEESTNNYTVDISGSLDIKYGQSQSYSCQFRNNGESIIDTATWSITADDGISASTLASITSQDGDSCTILGNSNNLTGYFKLYAKNADESISGYLRIQVKTLFG